MNISGKIHAESPIYRGNARKTMFTRDGDGTQKIVSLPGEIQGTAQSLMDAFTGKSNNGRNIGLLERLWIRLFNAPMPSGLITSVTCQLNTQSYPSDRFFDLRMGLTLNEDRWAAESNANYKMETLLRDSVFDFRMTVSDAQTRDPETKARLYYLLNELTEGRFWFGAGKSKGLGRIRLELDTVLPTPETVPAVNPNANHLRISLRFDSQNPILIGWNWGKVDQEAESSSFASVDGKALVSALSLPDYLAQQLSSVLGGPISSPDDWKHQLSQLLPRIISIQLQKNSRTEIESWSLPGDELAKLGKGKYGLSDKILEGLKPLTSESFQTKEEAEAAIKQAMSKKLNMADRVIKILKKHSELGYCLNKTELIKLLNDLDIDLSGSLDASIAQSISNEQELSGILKEACNPVFDRFFKQADSFINLLQSDVWVDAEIKNRQAHMAIKKMIRDGIITEAQWDSIDSPPKDISLNDWNDFQQSHARVRFSHLANQRNLDKSITNDQNMINFMLSYRNRARQELSQPQHIDFRSGGRNNNEVSQKFGKPYDTIFMRMLVWKPGQKDGSWEVYIPGSTLKGAFRKRASQVLKTLWGESRQTDEVLSVLFGRQGQKAIIHFSDAYLATPDNARSWCSMDGLKINPTTGKPVETAKFDYLYAYGPDLVFKMQLDLLDIDERDVQALSLLAHLIEDFKKGDVPLGGFKNSGMGWVQAQIEEITWLTGNPADIGRVLFGNVPMQQSGLWHQVNLQGSEADNGFAPKEPLVGPARENTFPLQTTDGYISHRCFGGYSGQLVIEAKNLTPVHIRESGEPSYVQQLPAGNVYGWDFFSMAPPDKSNRGDKAYALPSKSLRGMLRHVYSVASDSAQESPNISRLNPEDRLFGWVGKGKNQALMGRVSIGFAYFDAPSLGWYKVPFPYGEWQCANGTWTQQDQAKAKKEQISNQWRLFSNYPPAPLIEHLDDFTPDTVQATYLRAMSPGTTARFTIRFWNLEEVELRRLLWCIQLDADMAHKIGKSKYLGFGSLRLRVLPESYLIDWNTRYSADDNPDAGRISLDLTQWKRTDQDVYHYAALRRALNADAI